MVNFGERIKIERERKGLSVEDFGAMGGVSITAQYNYEKGKRKPDIDYLYNISRIGCDIQYIVTGVSSSTNITSKEAMILDLFRTAEEPYQLASIQVLKTNRS